MNSPHPKAHEQTTKKKTPPVLSEGLGQDWKYDEDVGEENCASASKEVVYRIRRPRTEQTK